MRKYARDCETTTWLDGLAAGCDPNATADENPFEKDWQDAHLWHSGFLRGRNAFFLEDVGIVTPYHD